MKNCMKCNATLPDFAQGCQFCGTQFSGDDRGPARGPDGARTVNLKNEFAWVWPAYYAVAGWWVLSGVIQIATGLNTKTFVVPAVIGAFWAVMGLGLIFRVELARGIANVLAFLRILSGALGLFGSFIAFGFMPGIAIYGGIGILMSLVDIVTGCAMIFLIGETDR